MQDPGSLINLVKQHLDHRTVHFAPSWVAVVPEVHDCGTDVGVQVLSFVGTCICGGAGIEVSNDSRTSRADVVCGNPLPHRLVVVIDRESKADRCDESEL